MRFAADEQRCWIRRRPGVVAAARCRQRPRAIADAVAELYATFFAFMPPPIATLPYDEPPPDVTRYVSHDACRCRHFDFFAAIFFLRDA